MKRILLLPLALILLPLIALILFICDAAEYWDKARRKEKI